MHPESHCEIPAIETTSFPNKFKNLWLAGVEAKLVFETHAGKAWGTLHVCLGEHPGQDQQPLVHPQEHPHKKLSPSKQRRMERRKAARVEEADVEAEEAPNSTF